MFGRTGREKLFSTPMTYFKDIWHDDPMTIPQDEDFRFVVEFVKKYRFLQRMGENSITDFVCNTTEEEPVIQEFHEFGKKLKQKDLHPRLHTWFQKRYKIEKEQNHPLPFDDFDRAVGWILETLDDLDGRYKWGGILNTNAEKN